MSAFDDYFAKMMPDAEKWLAEMAAEPVTGHPVVVPMDDDVPPGYFRPAGELFTVRKLSSVVVVPNELLMDAGVIPDTRLPRPPLPWRWRLRSKVTGWRERTARRAYKVIAGYWPADGEDDW